MKKSFCSLFFLCLALVLQGQDCLVCPGENVPLNATLNGAVGSITYSWVCNNGFTSNLSNPTVPNVTNQTTCTLNAIDQSGCQFEENLIIGVVNDPLIVIVESNCEISFSTQLLNGQACTAYNLQRLDGSTWVNVSSSLPYTVDQNANYRVAFNCTCGTYYSNTISVTGCDPCSPFTINNDAGDCFIYIVGSAPCGASGYEVWANINASQTCSPNNPPCNESTMTQVGTTTSTLYTASSDGCYQWRCTSGGVTYCSNVICVSSNCEVGCNGSIIFSTNPNNPPCQPFSNINWGCATGNWSITHANGTVVGSGNGAAPPNFTFTFDGVYTFSITCSDGCVYTSTYTVNGCGSAPCTPPSTLSIINNNCQLTASVSNCGSPPLYSWSTGASTQTISANASGTYTVTVTNCCVDPLISSITVNCNSCNVVANISGETSPCAGDVETYTVSVNNGSPPYSYQWTLDGVIVGSGSSYTYTAFTGTHSLSVQVTDSNNCVATDNHFINVDGCCCVGSTALNYDSNNCRLTWSGCSGYTSQLQRNTGSGYVNIVGTSPYNITLDANYRVVFSKSGCSDITSNTTVTGCTAACDCQITFTYDHTNCQYLYSATGCDSWQLRKSNASDCTGVTTVVSGTGDVNAIYDICSGEGIGYYNFVATESGCPIKVSDCLESNCDCCTSAQYTCQSACVEEAGTNWYIEIGGQQNIFYSGLGFLLTDAAVQNAFLNYLNTLTCHTVTALFSSPDCRLEVYGFDQIIQSVGSTSGNYPMTQPCN